MCIATSVFEVSLPVILCDPTYTVLPVSFFFIFTTSWFLTNNQRCVEHWQDNDSSDSRTPSMGTAQDFLVLDNRVLLEPFDTQLNHGKKVAYRLKTLTSLFYAYL